MIKTFTKELLEDLYLTQNFTLEEIRLRLGVSYGTIHNHMKKLGIHRRTTGEALRGVKKSEEHRKKLSESKKGNKHPNFGKKCSIHGKRCFWKESSGKTVSLRSSWEAAYADYLDRKLINWSYEAKTFITSIGAYTPDFYLNDTNEFVEIKGWLTINNKIRIDYFQKEYPDIRFLLLLKSDLIKLGIDLDKEYSGFQKPKKTCLCCAIKFVTYNPMQKFCSKSCASKISKREGWITTERKRKSGRVGYKNNATKLSTQQVIDIIELNKQGHTRSSISRITGASPGNVSNIVNNKSWKHLPR